MKRNIVLSLVLLFIGCKALALDGIGMFNSPKGIGLSGEFGTPQDGSFVTVNAYADIYGLPLGRTFYPGGRVDLTFNRVFKSFELSGVQSFFYGGVGACAGLVHDYEKPRRVTNMPYLENKLGLIAGVTGTMGFRFDVNPRISLDLGFSADLGTQLRPSKQGLKMDLYQNGLYRAYYPQLTIIWNL